MIPKSYKFIPLLVLGFLVLTPQITHAEFLQETLWKAVTGIFGTILALCAWLFDAAINNYVIGFADEYTTSGIGLAIDQGWSLVRDIMNLVFIFGLLYIGFKIILNSDDSSTRKLLVNLIVAALLVNFSLFITKFVVDTSNSLAAQVAINGFVGAEEKVNDAPGAPTRYQVDMSEDLMARLGLSTIFSYNSDANAAIQNEWGYIFGTAILLIVASFVFAAGAVLLIIRFVALNFYILFSPLMFIGWAFPPLARHTTEYWKGFLGKAFFAPIYLLFIYFSVSIITALRENRGLNDFASDTLGNALQNPSGAGVNAIDRLNSASAFPYFILATASLIMSLVVAQRLGANGASQAISIGQNMRRGAQKRLRRGAVATSRFATRQTAGRAVRVAGSVAAGQERRLNRSLASMAQQGGASRAAARFIDRTAGSGLRKTQNASVAGSESYTARGTRIATQNVRLNRIDQENTRANEIADERENYINADITTEPGRAARRAASNAMGGRIRRMSNDEIVEVAENDRELLESPEFLQHLTESQMEAIKNSGLLTNSEYRELGNSRNDAIIDETTVAFNQASATADELNTAFEELGQTIRNMSAERKAALGSDRLQRQEVAVHLTDRDIEQLEQSGRFNATEIRDIRAARDAAQNAIADGTRPITSTVLGAREHFLERQRRNMMRDARQAGQMSPEVFTEFDMGQYLTPEAVANRLRNGVTNLQREAIRDNIENYVHSTFDADESARRREVWRNAARGGANSSFVASLGLRI